MFSMISELDISLYIFFYLDETNKYLYNFGG